jgi:hypothetical protein
MGLDNPSAQIEWQPNRTSHDLCVTEEAPPLRCVTEAKSGYTIPFLKRYRVAIGGAFGAKTESFSIERPISPKTAQKRPLDSGVALLGRMLQDQAHTRGASIPNGQRAR